MLSFVFYKHHSLLSAHYLCVLQAEIIMLYAYRYVLQAHSIGSGGFPLCCMRRNTRFQIVSFVLYKQRSMILDVCFVYQQESLISYEFLCVLHTESLMLYDALCVSHIIIISFRSFPLCFVSRNQ